MPKPSDSDHVLDTIREASAIGYTPGFSVCDSLLAAKWVSESDLVEGFQTLEDGDPNRSVLFGQLPAHIKLPSRWISIPAELGNPEVRFTLVGTTLNDLAPGGEFMVIPRRKIGDAERFKNAKLDSDAHGLLLRTQLMVSFKLWEHRRLFYERYLKALGHAASHRAVLVEPPQSWLKGRRAITAEMYEHDLLERLHRETVHMLRSILLHYAVSCSDPAAASGNLHLDAVFMMVKGGRLVVRGSGRSSIAQSVAPLSIQDHDQNLRAFEEQLAGKRDVSVYERYLLEAFRQLDSGASNLGIVQAVMILEWFVNEIVADHIVRPVSEKIESTALRALVAARLWGRSVRLPEKVREYLPLAGVSLPPELLKEVLAAIDLRNSIVHTSQSKTVAGERATRAISAVSRLIRTTLLQLMSTKKNGRKTTSVAKV